MQNPLLLVAAACLATAGALAQSPVVSGTVALDDFIISEPPDVPGNSMNFGSWAGGTLTPPGVILTYSDGASGSNAAFTQVLTRPSATWNWQRLDGSGMQLDEANRLILTGTQTSNPTSIVIDPGAGQITVNGEQVLTGGSPNFSVSSTGDIGIGTSSPEGKLDVEGTGNVLFNSGKVGIGGDPSGPDTENSPTFPAPVAPLVISDPGSASIRLMTTRATNSLESSIESLDFIDGAARQFVGEVAGVNADYPGGSLYQPSQMVMWSGQPGGILLLARDWPGGAGPIVFADGDPKNGEVMRIATSKRVGVGGETAPASLISVKGNASIGSDYSETAAPADGMIIEGNVGIGTAAPGARLDVEGEGNVVLNSGKVGVGAENAPANLLSVKGNGSIGSGYSEAAAPPNGMIIEGSVGIGTNSPKSPLDVNGTVMVSGTNSAVLINPQGDLPMGPFTTGTPPR